MSFDIKNILGIVIKNLISKREEISYLMHYIGSKFGRKQKIIYS